MIKDIQDEEAFKNLLNWFNPWRDKLGDDSDSNHGKIFKIGNDIQKTA